MLHNLQLVNYNHPDCTPLKNIMRLPREEAFAQAARMAQEHPDAAAFGRFADFANYYPRRLETDRLLYETFIEMGGRPAERHPLSFALEGSDYLEAWFDHGTVTRIPLACVSPEQISFTLGDSLAMREREGRFTMLTLDMLRAEASAHPQGMAGYLQDVRAKYRYIEVQLWDDTPCFFVRAAEALSLGTLTAPPVRLSGGFTHRMFRLDTTAGAYAVKLLNPEIMQRADALDNYRAAEACEALLEAQGLPILPSKTIGGRKLQCVDGQYLYVFDYFDGRVLQQEEITPVHCARIGAVLARIHGVQPACVLSEGVAPAPAIPWFALAEKLLASDDARAEGELLHAAVPMLTRLTAAAGVAVRRLPRKQALCHNDMDPKNVLWRGDDFRIIDLECLGYADPMQELLDLAITWSEPTDEKRFRAFVTAYDDAGGARLTDAALIYDSRRNNLDWLAYNAARALSDDVEERRIARKQVRGTLEKLENDARNREKILDWLRTYRS